MIRRAFTMRLKPDSLADYRRHHDTIWPELVAQIERSGIATITTFQRGLDLFLTSEIADEAAWSRLWNSEVHKRWAQVMEPLMHLDEDGIVDAGELTEIFHLTTNGNGQAPPTIDPPGSSTVVERAIVEVVIEAEATAEPDAAMPTGENSNGAPVQMPAAADDVPGAPVETPAAPVAEPARGKPARRSKRSAGKKKPVKKIKRAPARKKAKRKRARRRKARVAAKRVKKSTRKKSAKKAARKKAAPKKARRIAKKKKKAARKHR